jgi:hypothetical protein
VNTLRAPWGAVTIAAAVSLVLAALTYRAGRLLTFDGYHYVELAKQFTSVWPDRFGNHWPFGYPLMGALLARIGFPAYEALGLLSVASLIGLLACSARILGQHPLRLPWMVSLAAAPVLAVQLFGVLTELPLAAILIALAACLGHWPARTAIWSAAGCAVAALGIRYAGIIAFPAFALWLVVRRHDLQAAGQQRTAIAAGLAAVAVAAFLLGLNVVQSGHLSGASRTGAGGLAMLPREFVDFGWSIPSALFAGGLRERLGPGVPGLMVGGVVFAALTALCAWAWLRPKTRFSRPLALVVFGYASGMAVLHCVGSFDPLYNARTFLPILFPCGLLVAECLADRRLWLALAAGILVAAGTASAARGLSREVGGDVRAAVAPVRARLAAGDVVAINDHAFSLSAYIRQRTVRALPEFWTATDPERLLVVVAPPRNRRGDPGVMDPDWLRAVRAATAAGSHQVVIDSPSLLVVEKVAQPTPAVRPVPKP